MWLALIFLALTLLTGVLGFGLLIGTAWLAAKVLFFVFLVLFLVSYLGAALGAPIP